LETFFLVEEKHAYSVQIFHDHGSGPTGARGMRLMSGYG
jgi:hypothetical protein